MEPDGRAFILLPIMFRKSRLLYKLYSYYQLDGSATESDVFCTKNAAAEYSPTSHDSMLKAFMRFVDAFEITSQQLSQWPSVSGPEAIVPAKSVNFNKLCSEGELIRNIILALSVRILLFYKGLCSSSLSSQLSNDHRIAMLCNGDMSSLLIKLKSAGILYSQLNLDLNTNQLWQIYTQELSTFLKVLLNPI